MKYAIPLMIRLLVCFCVTFELFFVWFVCECTWSPAPMLSSSRLTWTPFAISTDCCSIATKRLSERQSKPNSIYVFRIRMVVVDDGFYVEFVKKKFSIKSSISKDIFCVFYIIKKKNTIKIAWTITNNDNIATTTLFWMLNK